MVTISLSDLGARHGRRMALSGITTPTFTDGEVIAVIGPNAAGKSTLFKRMAGLLPGPGQVDLTNDGGTRPSICYMPQDTQANAVLSVYESILLARKQGASWSVSPQDLTIIDRTLADLDIENLSHRTIAELSGGQRQLVGIAQALVREPSVLLMDEPTAALDLYRQVEVLSFARRLAKERGMIIFAALHDLNDVLQYTDRTLLIAEGRLAACGPSPEIITEETLRVHYNVAARVEPCSRGVQRIIVDGKCPSSSITIQ